MKNKKVILITGTSSGMGKATAIKLHNDGHIVYATGTNVEKIKDLKDMGLKTLYLDVTNDKSMVDAVEFIIQNENKIDVLINNAGYGSYGALEDVKMTEARKQMDVNLFGVSRLTQLVLPHMRKQRNGYVINIASVAAKIWEPFGCWYHSSKFALEGLSDCLRVEVKQFGIKIVIVEPGIIQTNWQKIAFDKMNESLEKSEFEKDSKIKMELYGGMGSEKQRIKASKPKLIANKISKIINKNNPRSRYALGKGAKFMTYAKRIFPDCLMDKLTLMMYEKKTK